MSRRLSFAAILSVALSATCAQSQSAPATGAAAPQNGQATTSGAANPIASQSRSDRARSVATVERGPDKWMTPDLWSTFNGDLKAQKFSPAALITPDNVGGLKMAWETHTGDVSDGSGGKPATGWAATPLFVNDTLYLGTPFYRVIALEPDTGKVKWTFNPHAVLKALTQPDLKNRGVAYWQAANPQAGEACEKMVYVGTMDAKLYGVDADTGKPCPNFGKNGMVDVNQWNTANDKWPLSLLQPPTVYHDTLFLGWAGRDWTDSAAPPGSVFALDARTGALKWTFDALPDAATSTTGTANVWASMSIDPETGLLYIPVSSPSPNFYGGAREEKLPLATSVTALDSETGKVVWSRQLVHHDIWDYDTNSAPVLIDIKKDGKTIPALVQSSKQGFLFVLNRKTGEPIYPIEEKAVPKSNIPGEQASPTQPYVATPAPTVPDLWPGVSTLADVASLGSCSREAKKLRYDGRFTPPSLQGSSSFPATTGGVEWGGGAVDPASDTYVVNSSRVVQIYQLIKRADYAKDAGKTGYYAQAGSALRSPSDDLSQSARHALLEAALRNVVVLRPEDRQASLERAVRRGPEMGLLYAEILGIGDHRRAGRHQVGPDLHRRLDGLARAGHRSEERQGLVAQPRRRARRRDACGLCLQGPGICRFRCRRKLHSVAESQRSDRSLRAAEWRLTRGLSAGRRFWTPGFDASSGRVLADHRNGASEDRKHDQSRPHGLDEMMGREHREPALARAARDLEPPGQHGGRAGDAGDLPRMRVRLRIPPATPERLAGAALIVAWLFGAMNSPSPAPKAARPRQPIQRLTTGSITIAVSAMQGDEADRHACDAEETRPHPVRKSRRRTARRFRC